MFAKVFAVFALVFVGCAGETDSPVGGGDVQPTGSAGSSCGCTQGPEGPAGEDGAPGPVGPTGPQGPEGPQGPQGATGFTGQPGPAGVAGPAGAQGPMGQQGPMGPMGPQGIQGNPGADGALVSKNDIYVVPMTTVMLAWQEKAFSVGCNDQDDILLKTNCELPPGGHTLYGITSSGDGDNAQVSTGTCWAKNNSSVNVQVTVRVVCIAVN